MKIEISGKRGKNKYVLIDEWFYKKYIGKKYYISGDNYVSFKEKGHNYYIHRLVLNAPNEMEVDHINGNKLDNRSSNLRLCTRQQNEQGKPARKNNLSGYKGVRTKNDQKRTKRFQAVITINGKLKSLGYYATAKEAALIYNQIARQYHGEFAYQNRLIKRYVND